MARIVLVVGVVGRTLVVGRILIVGAVVGVVRVGRVLVVAVGMGFLRVDVFYATRVSVLNTAVSAPTTSTDQVRHRTWVFLLVWAIRHAALTFALR